MGAAWRHGTDSGCNHYVVFSLQPQFSAFWALDMLLRFGLAAIALVARLHPASRRLRWPASAF
jgi:hypothetical protein